tara:strand:+ start:329 stop:559 length:231 start_codon:yes stop_codon:yes gene_type:complete
MAETSERRAVDERDERRADERYPDLRCPHCNVWIGDPDDPDIATVSVKHDLDECCYVTAEELRWWRPVPDDPPEDV